MEELVRYSLQFFASGPVSRDYLASKSSFGDRTRVEPVGGARLRLRFLRFLRVCPGSAEELPSRFLGDRSISRILSASKGISRTSLHWVCAIPVVCFERTIDATFSPTQKIQRLPATKHQFEGFPHTIQPAAVQANQFHYDFCYGHITSIVLR